MQLKPINMMVTPVRDRRPQEAVAAVGLNSSTPFKGRVKECSRRFGFISAENPKHLQGKDIFFFPSQLEGVDPSAAAGTEVEGKCVAGGFSGHRAEGPLRQPGSVGVTAAGASSSAPPCTTWRTNASVMNGRDRTVPASPSVDCAMTVASPPVSNTFSTRTASSPPVSSARKTFPIGDDSGNTYDERWFAQVSTHIVGVAHHDGKLSDREEVSFKGKMVMNMNGEQVGWLPKEISPLLLPLLNQQGDRMHVEGVVPRGANNKFKVPLDLQVYGQPSDTESIQTVLDRLDTEKPQYAGLLVIRAPMRDGIRVVDLEELLPQEAKKEEMKGLNKAQILGQQGKKTQNRGHI